MHISNRLKCIAECVTPGNIVADVGCDHGLTSIYLVSNNISKLVYAMDINKGPLERASLNTKLYGVSDKIILRLSDGLKEVKDDELIESVIISGMGGHLIMDILDVINERDYLKNNIRELILSPQSDIYRVRHYLHDNNYAIADEYMVCEEEKYYNIIRAVRGSQHYDNEYYYIYWHSLIAKKDKTYLYYV